MAKEGKIKPLGDHILIRRVEAENMTKGGIVLPDSAKEKVITFSSEG
jgi:chaperonin GroES